MKHTKMARLKKFIVGFMMACAVSSGAAMADDGRSDHLLPPNFTVYRSGDAVVNHPMPGARAVRLPTRNLYRGQDGGYVACYSHREAGSAYPVGGDIYVVGQVRLRGAYDGRIFQPRGYRGKDISALPKFKQICGRALKVCHDDACWAGGDTGGWFGIP